MFDRSVSPSAAQLDELIGALEADQFQRLSGWAGHVRPLSSWPYINQLEEPLSELMSGARPAAWNVAPSEVARSCFPDLKLDEVPPDQPVLQIGQIRRPFITTADVGLGPRLLLSIGVADRRRYDIAGAAAVLDAELSLRVLYEVQQGMEISGLTKRAPREIKVGQEAIRAYRAWIVDASAPKLKGVDLAIQSLMEVADTAKLRQLFEAWRQVRVGEHLCMNDGYTGAAFISLLQELGVPNRCLLIKSRAEARALDPAISSHKLQIVEIRPKKEKVQHRLQLIEADADPIQASGKQVSSVGLHWLMVLVASWLLARQEIKWS